MDLAQTWWIVPISLLSSCLLSFLWVILIRLLAAVMVRSSSIIPISSKSKTICLYRPGPVLAGQLVEWEFTPIHS